MNNSRGKRPECIFIRDELHDLLRYSLEERKRIFEEIMPTPDPKWAGK